MIFSAGCTRPQPVVEPAEKATISAVIPAEKTKEIATEKPLFSREVKESLFFAASLERESLRLISRHSSMEPTTLFSVLSYAFEIASGTKKSSLRNVDCGRFQVEKTETGLLRILKICEKPAALIATVQPKMNETELEVDFKIKEWASVVGLSVTLTNPDVKCHLKIKDKKLSEMSCENWAYFLSASDASATEIQLKTFSFRRDQTLQLKLTGGFYRDLVERKKIDISVPLEGKIKLIEKEIEVKDDFADKVKTSEEIRGEKEKNKEDSKENGKEINAEEKEAYQRWIKEGENQGESENPPVVAPEEIREGESSGGVPIDPQPSTRPRGR